MPEKERLVHVKVENINMPFLAMVGLMFKVAIAAAVVGTIVAIFWFLVFGSFFAVILSGAK
jgi:hypothetical protein